MPSLHSKMKRLNRLEKLSLALTDPHLIIDYETAALFNTSLLIHQYIELSAKTVHTVVSTVPVLLCSRKKRSEHILKRF